jgi:hypothetical protein
VGRFLQLVSIVGIAVLGLILVAAVLSVTGFWEGDFRSPV